MIKREAIGSFISCNFLTFLGFATIHYSIFWRVGFSQHITLASLSSTYSRLRDFFNPEAIFTIPDWAELIVKLLQFTEAVVRRCSLNKVFLEISQNSLENTCASISFLITLQPLGQSLLFNKVEGLRPATLSKKRLSNRCFPVNFSKFLRTLWKTSIYIIRMEIQANFSEAVNWRNIFPRNRWCHLTFSEHLFSQNTSLRWLLLNLKLSQ